jgi:hypothetical protein
MIEKKNTDKNDNQPNDGTIPDETTHLFVFGNIKVIDVRTKEVLVNKRF